MTKNEIKSIMDLLENTNRENKITVLEEFKQVLNKTIAELNDIVSKGEDNKVKNKHSTILFEVEAELGIIRIDFWGLEQEIKNPTGFIAIIENICKHKDIKKIYVYNSPVDVPSAVVDFLEELMSICNVKVNLGGVKNVR